MLAIINTGIVSSVWKKTFEVLPARIMPPNFEVKSPIAQAH
jgi:hypothetical protein